MPDAPEFSSVVVSRRGRHERLASQVWSFAAVAALYAVALILLIVVPLLVLESVDPPKAGIRIDVPVFKTPGGGGHSAPTVHPPRGAGGAVKPRPAPPRPKMASIDPTPLPAPESPPDFGPAVGPDGPEGPPGGPNAPDGPGGGTPGPPCPGCPPGGPPGPPGEGIDPYLPGTPGLVPPVLIPATRALPKYPDLARRAGIMASVILLAVIEKDGRVGEIEVMKNPDQRWGFDLAAIEAVKQWRYQPALMNGEPVAAYIQVMVEFSLARP